MWTHSTVTLSAFLLVILSNCLSTTMVVGTALHGLENVYLAVLSSGPFYSVFRIFSLFYSGIGVLPFFYLSLSLTCSQVVLVSVTYKIKKVLLVSFYLWNLMCKFECQIGRAYFEMVDYLEADNAFGLARLASPYSLEGMDMYSTVLYVSLLCSFSVSIRTSMLCCVMQILLHVLSSFFFPDKLFDFYFSISRRTWNWVIWLRSWYRLID